MDVLADWVRITGTSGVLLARCRVAAPWGMAIGQTREAMFHIIAEGSCWLRCGDRAPLQLLQGDLVLLPHGDPHELVHEPAGVAEPLPQLLARLPLPDITGPATRLLCGAYRSEASISPRFLSSLPPVVPFSAARVRANPRLASTLSLLTAELEQPGAGSELLIQHLFDALFVYLVRSWSEEAGASPPGWLSALKDPALAKAISSMHVSPQTPWTVEALAHEASLSRAAFARRFTEHVGEAPLAYLTRWRMGLAARLLRDTEAPVAEIAGRVGYESEFSFSRAFKRSQGVAPARFRRGVGGSASAAAV